VTAFSGLSYDAKVSMRLCAQQFITHPADLRAYQELGAQVLGLVEQLRAALEAMIPTASETDEETKETAGTDEETKETGVDDALAAELLALQHIEIPSPHGAGAYATLHDLHQRLRQRLASIRQSPEQERDFRAAVADQAEWNSAVADHARLLKYISSGSADPDVCTYYGLRSEDLPPLWDAKENCRRDDWRISADAIKQTLHGVDRLDKPTYRAIKIVMATRHAQAEAREIATLRAKVAELEAAAPCKETTRH
jgi:hypothetical protein